MRFIANEILSWLWNFFIWGSIGYYVFERGESGWWFLLPICLTATRSKKDEKNDDTD